MVSSTNARLAGLLLIGAVLSGCSSPWDPVEEAPTTELLVLLDHDAEVDGDVVERMELRCDAEVRRLGVAGPIDRPRSAHHDVEVVCAGVRAAAGELTAAFDDDEACAAVSAGPQEAVLSGTIGGQPVSTTVRRDSSCGVALWSRLSVLLGAPDGATKGL